jgi:hypothetical protein
MWAPIPDHQTPNCTLEAIMGHPSSRNTSAMLLSAAHPRALLVRVLFHHPPDPALNVHRPQRLHRFQGFLSAAEVRQLVETARDQYEQSGFIWKACRMPRPNSMVMWAHSWCRHRAASTCTACARCSHGHSHVLLLIRVCLRRRWIPGTTKVPMWGWGGWPSGLFR